jgi:hypothetical protein
VVILCAGCVSEPGSTAAPDVDLELFDQLAMPVLALHCAGSGCHGTPDRPLALYARSAWRQDPADLVPDPPLTDDELRHNAMAAFAFVDAAAPEDSALLRRPLHPDAGGSDHGGGAQFAEVSDPDYALLLRWVTRASTP